MGLVYEWGGMRRESFGSGQLSGRVLGQTGGWVAWEDRVGSGVPPLVHVKGRIC